MPRRCAAGDGSGIGTVNNFGRNLALWVIVALLLVALFNLFQPAGTGQRGAQQVAYSDFLNEVNAGHVRDVTIQGRTVSGQLSDGRAFQTYTPEDPALVSKLTDKGIRALMDSQFKFGGDASVAVATIGAGVQGSTTTALRADIVAFAQTRGLFAGLSLEGTLLSQRSEWNQIYYGQALSPQQVVLNGQGQNPGAEPLKEMLGRMAAE